MTYDDVRRPRGELARRGMPLDPETAARTRDPQGPIAGGLALLGTTAPLVEDLGDVGEVVCSGDAGKQTGGVAAVGPGEGAGGGESGLGSRGIESTRFEAQAAVPAHDRALEPRWVGAGVEEAETQGIAEREAGKLTRSSGGQGRRVGLDGTAEAGVRRPLDTHERMFARAANRPIPTSTHRSCTTDPSSPSLCSHALRASSSPTAAPHSTRRTLAAAQRVR